MEQPLKASLPLWYRSPMDVRRLSPGDETLAQDTFAMMAAVFEEESDQVSLGYTRRLLARETFWALAALHDDEVVGGLTAHALPMTRSEATELFIYDIAVRADHQRRGVGHALMRHLFDLGKTAGISVSFVPADNEDTHAIDFYRRVGGVESPVTFFTFEQ